jgi:putative membrane protein
MKKPLLFISCVLLVAGCAHRASMGGGGNMNSDTSTASTKGSGGRAGGAATSELSQQDSTFVREALQAGLAEVQMGQLTVQHAQDPMLKQFGERLVADHSKANEELMKLATAKRLQIPSQINARQAEMVQALSGANGADFDRLCSQDAVQAHTDAIQKFKMAAQTSQDPDIKAFAQKTLPVLEQHLKDAKQFNSGRGISDLK